MRRITIITFLAGFLHIVAVAGAYLLNITMGDELEARFVCNPYIDGCVSISRAARSGPGLYLFRALMFPAAVLLVLSWRGVRDWLDGLAACTARRSRTIFILGAAGAVFLVFYVTALGTEGEWYRLMRRYGVTVYFGGTALAQLLLVAVLWPSRHAIGGGRLARPTVALMALVATQWLMGVLSVAKRLLIGSPEVQDMIENLIEWWFALPMALAFIAIAALFSQSSTQEKRKGDQPPVSLR